MRPIKRGASPLADDYDDYKKAKKELISRLGGYCSYCERPIKTNLAVEHIQPKGGDYAHHELIGKWTNFLLACVNCNSTKKDKEVNLDQLLIPDRDNTFYAYEYTSDGKVISNPNLTPDQIVIANNSLKLVGLDKPVQKFKDSNDKLVALDRPAQRMETIIIAREALACMLAVPNNNMEIMIVQSALASGFFSIWMKVFDEHSAMKIRLIKAFKGTEESGCFDMTTGNLVVPAPNLDALDHGGKV